MIGKFKDATGREWQWPAFTLRITNRVRDEHLLNLRHLLKRDNEEVALRISDDEVLFGIFKDLCNDQVQASALTEDQLQDLWDETTVPAAKDALLERFFSFSQGSKKAALIMRGIRGETTSATSTNSAGSGAASSA